MNRMIKVAALFAVISLGFVQSSFAMKPIRCYICACGDTQCVCRQVAC